MERLDRYYGIYRGIVVNTDDPLGKNRVTLQVPQVSGEQVTDWAWPINASIFSTDLAYGVFTKNSDATISSVNTADVVQFDTTEDNGGGVYLSSTEPSKVYVSRDGDYQILFSPQFANTNSSTVQADIWLRVNGVDVPRTSSRVTMSGNPNETVLTVPFIIDLEAGDYVEIAWETNHSTVYLQHVSGLTNPTRPDIPSVILSINMIGNYKPLPGRNCWVMYEGGDPNFPVWIGEF